MFIRNGYVKSIIGHWINMTYVVAFVVKRAGDQYHICVDIMKPEMGRSEYIDGPYYTLEEAQYALDVGMGL